MQKDYCQTNCFYFIKNSSIMFTGCCLAKLKCFILNCNPFFLSSILSDLKLDLLPKEATMIIEYIRTLIFECERNVSQSPQSLTSYSCLICCNLLSILNDEYANEMVIDKGLGLDKR